VDASERALQPVKWIGLVAGPLVAWLVLQFLPESYVDAAGDTVAFGRAGHLTFFLMVWMAIWWLTEAIDIEATALLPVVVLPMVGAATIQEAGSAYANPLLFLFMGGFLMALAMQRWGLDRRIALRILMLIGTSPARLIGGFMIATALLSSFISNTATTAMMLPIGLSIIQLFGRHQRAEGAGKSDQFAVCLMLSIAYAASIGGIGTIIGTPPNGYLVEFIRDTTGEEIGFLRWMTIGYPVVLVFLPLTWLLLTRVLHPVPRKSLAGAHELLAGELAGMGRTGRGEWVTLIAFGGAILGWLTRPLLARPGWVPGLSDAGVALTAGLVLFVIPVDARKREFVLDWSTAKKMPWGVLILLGGGISLARAVDGNGVAAWIGSQAQAFGGLPSIALMLIVVAGMTFLTELTSNAATTATIIPILFALAPGLGVDPYFLIVPATIAASCAFMLPVATPPNAILFGSGHITIPQMCRAGLVLNLVGVAVITAVMYLVALPLLGV
jgi:sodium-dependent dicarboxylate transporter 2/3/5